MRLNRTDATQFVALVILLASAVYGLPMLGEMLR